MNEEEIKKIEELADLEIQKEIKEILANEPKDI